MNPRFFTGDSILDIFDTATNFHAVYYYMIKNFANPAILLTTIW
jgi:hypothetical protein